MSDLAIDGGPRTVTTSMNDSWQDVSDLEKQYVNYVLDNKDDAYAQLDKFEEEYRIFVGTKHALCMCNGTAALHSAFFAAGACAGKEVIVPTATWHATITPILHCNATPVFCEVDPETFCADPRGCQKADYTSHMRDCGDTYLRQSCRYGCVFRYCRGDRYCAD